ncbi:MAG: hypothetical protein VKP70_07135 [Cyanobacteriota bacterium]|nr:hypothetical protein [Cyanobacteriota bacterium]
MLHALVFVLSREDSLLKAATDWPSLLAAQRQGLRSGTQLRLFRLPEPMAEGSGDDVIRSGALKPSGGCPQTRNGPAQVICDALVPLIEPRSLWLGVYQVQGPQEEGPPGLPGLGLSVEAVTCLDCYPLQEAANETCWFYPTENGRYLAWENRRRLQTLPGVLPDRTPQDTPFPYAHGDVHLLWSLMADDHALTCVGLTWRRQRIEWPLRSEAPEELATWTEFQIDSMAESSYQELNSVTMFNADEPES